jgi:hypothetical protein
MTASKATAAIVAVGLMVVAATVATAQEHGMGPPAPGMIGPMHGMAPGAPTMGPGVMGRGQMTPGMMGQMGPGMMGEMGPGMMGQMHGMMGPGMQGGAMGPGMMSPMGVLRVTPTVHITTDDVRHFLEHHLTQHGLEHLKVGEVTQTDRDTITADLVTTENSLAVRLLIDTHSGWVKGLS